MFKRHKRTALIFILPQVLVVILFFILPALKALSQSLFYSDAFGTYQVFAGLGNFIDLAQDEGYRHSFWVTFLIAFLIACCTQSLGVLIAYFVAHLSKSQGFYKVVLIWPYAVAPAIAAILWRFLWQPSIGFLTGLFHYLGIEVNYLTHPIQALLIIVLAASWQQFSYNFLFYLAAIKSIPGALIDASKLEGASSLQRFFHIMLPMLSPTTFFLLIMNMIYGFFETFGVIDILTAGGPSGSTETLIYKVYQDGFVGLDRGYSAAESVVLLFIVSFLTYIQFKFVEKKVHYQ